MTPNICPPPPPPPPKKEESLYNRSCMIKRHLSTNRDDNFSMVKYMDTPMWSYTIKRTLMWQGKQSLVKPKDAKPSCFPNTTNECFGIGYKDFHYFIS